jgi:two-component system chemotaxis response regulator CheB
MTDVLIVDDSSVYRKFLAYSLEKSGRIRVSGHASSGEEALEQLKKNRPQVVLMDIHMPGMDGFETTKRIMSLYPVPVIIISSDYASGDQSKTFRALEAGAVSFMPKPPGDSSPEHEKKIQDLVTQVRLMSEVKVVRRTYLSKVPERSPDTGTVNVSPKTGCSGNVTLVGIGASAGGPVAVAELLSLLSADFEIPIVIVQHIDPFFVNGFADWLCSTTGRTVEIAANETAVTKKKVFLPPPDMNIGFSRQGVFRVERSAPFKGIRPSVDNLFRSMADIYGKNSVGILLSGMGNDGAEALNYLRKTGACTIAQDEGSSLIHGMPGEAIKLNAARLILPPAEISSFLNNLKTIQE